MSRVACRWHDRPRQGVLTAQHVCASHDVLLGCALDTLLRGKGSIWVDEDQAAVEVPGMDLDTEFIKDKKEKHYRQQNFLWVVSEGRGFP